MKPLSFCAGTFLLFAVAGCGPTPVKVNGVLKMDGQPVEGATVTFMSEDGTKSYSGQTDSSGNFELVGPQKPGALPGEYKVLVMKSKAGPEMSPESGDYKKMMEKMTKETGGSKIQTGPAYGDSKKASGGIKTELPPIYANVKTTPLTQKVPPDTQPVVIDIKAKP